MRGELPSHTAGKGAAAKERRSTLETTLALAGFGAWLWCAYEIAMILVK
jgi:hypothetical protein